MMKDEDELFTCCWCGDAVNNIPFDVICCEIPEQLKGQFIKEEEGRIVNIMLGTKVVPVGVPGKDSEIAQEGADITFMCCSDECRRAVEERLEEAGFQALRNNF